ncbi:MAG: class I SAM-dependent methyltransferase [Chitinophagaceae bacterium]|jgi:predicted O-methyltransferase YrrM|nr:MAG: class I SAM-dependent methyltransferase [Chitinophagaceae bacterium]
MNLTNSQRVVKLAGNLLSNPGLIPPYLKHNVFSKKYPIDWKMPWWSYRAIEYVDTIVGNKTIFEYGTGGSTVRFASKAKSIVAVEDDEKWMEMVQDRLKKLGINNVEIHFRPFDFHNPAGYEQSEYLRLMEIVVGDFDIVIIDGQDHTFRERIRCFHYVEPRMKAGQYIIVDDFWRYEELLKDNRAKEVKVFESVGPCRFGVTSTAVFIY